MINIISMSKIKKNISTSDVENYSKISPREHILLRPDTYIGDIESTIENMWVYILPENQIIEKNVTYTPGLFKCLDELLVNARDASVNDQTCNLIKIYYNIEEGFISIYNNGDNGIPVDIHPVHQTLIPTMIFGELLTSSNYNDDDDRTTGGRNGYGAKLANIFSTKFIVEVDDAKRSKRFKQIWYNNMETFDEPIITKLPAKIKSSVKITFYPDFKRFKIDNLDNDHYNILYRRAIDIAGTSNKLNMYFNDVKINCNNFKNYIELYNFNSPIYFDDNNERWNIGIIYKPDCGEKVISFVNSISTYNGGTHCTHVIDNILKILINNFIKKKDKDIKITPTLLKDNLIFFINSIIINPAFSSQTKNTLTTKIDKFGSKYEPNETFLKKLAKCGIIEQVIELAKFKENSNLKKTDGKKQIKIIGIPKLEDANKAGTKESSKCTLILTEGDSAKATAMAGLGVIGRDYYGVFPLKGKILNVRDAPPAQLLANEEIKSLKLILGLKQNLDYSNINNFNKLRYGHILLLTDQDFDGSHIKGLFINFLHALWPSLVKYDNFVQTLSTPIVKAFKLKNTLEFYTMTEYNNWKESDDSDKWKIKYYKGLGTSTGVEAREYFTDINKKLITYYWDNDEKDDDSIKLAFDKSRSDDRKKWLMKYDKNNILTYEQKKIQYNDFINLDLIHFSNEDLIRSIPSVIDGLKPSQRKILYGAILRGLDKDEIKVSQLAGFVSDKAAYHHGEMSLNGAIIGMAQNFIGSNNINILKPCGQFGTILKGGKDAASSRYIWTMLEDLTSIIFNTLDNPILNLQDDDGMPIEPEFYAPIIPMILVNGAEGIGTGFSTKIPPYNPLDIINNLQNIINDKPFIPMDPWWKNFKGRVIKIDNHNYEIYGNYDIKGNTVIITELPIGEWTSNYKEYIEKLLEESSNAKNKAKIPIISYKDNNTDSKVHFELLFEDNYLETNDIEKILHLTKKYSINNMHLYNSENCIKKYNNVEEIMLDYYNVRLSLYEKRKNHQLNILEKELELISYKVKFILLVINNELIINNKKKILIEEELEKLNFPKLGNDKLSYDYLLNMYIHSLTFEKIEILKNQHQEKQTEYDELKNKSIKQIWLDELDILLNKYNKWIKKYI